MVTAWTSSLVSSPRRSHRCKHDQLLFVTLVTINKSVMAISNCVIGIRLVCEDGFGYKVMF